MAQTTSATSDLTVNTITIKDFCDQHKIPYLFVHVDINKTKKGPPQGQFSGWKDKTYSELMKHNKVIKKTYNTILINLKPSEFFVIDIDSVGLVDEKYKEYGQTWETKSIKRGLPHLWRKKDPNFDYTTKQLKDFDIVVDHVYERIDGVFYNTNDTMSTTVFNVEPKIEKKVNKVNKSKKSKNKTEVSKKKVDEKEQLFKYNTMGVENTDIVDNIDIKYFENYGDWLKIMWALYNVFESFELCDCYSKKTKNYKGLADVKKYVLHDKQKCLTFGTLAYYSKLSNPKKYNNIRLRHTHLSATDFQMAKVYLDLIEDTVIKFNDILYIYKYPFWIQDTNKCFILNNLRYVLTNHYYLVRKSFVEQNIKLKSKCEDNQTPEQADQMLELEKKIKTTGMLVQQIEQSKKQESVYKQIFILLQNQNYEMDLNSPDLFAFSCGTIFDTSTQTKIEGSQLKYSYISKHTGYPYNKPETEQIQLLNSIIEDIMPNVEIRKSYLSILKQTLLGKVIEKFILFNGEGCNGKGWTLELLKEVLFDYMVNANKDILVSPIKTGANSELARFDKKRCIVFSEPEEGHKLNGSTIKQLTGGGVMEARGLYQSAKDIHIHGTQILECNQRPAIKGRTDNALLRRIIDIEFEMKFTGDEHLLESEPDKYIKENRFYKSDEFKSSYKYAFFHIILEAPNELYVADCVKQRSKDYLIGNDEIITWFNNTLKITNDNKDHTSWVEVYDYFKESDFYKNLSMLEKRHEFSKISLAERIKSNIELSKYWCDRVSNKMMKGFKGVIINVEEEAETLGDI